MQKRNLIAVRFLTASAPYNSGEQAGFEKAHAFKLVDMKIAEFVEAPPGLDVRGHQVKEPDAPVAKKKKARKKAAPRAPVNAKAKPKPKAKAKAKPKG